MPTREFVVLGGSDADLWGDIDGPIDDAWAAAVNALRPTSALAEFTAALHYGPGPHPDGSPQSVHAGGSNPAPKPATPRRQPDYDDPNVKWRAWLESVVVSAYNEKAKEAKRVVGFLKQNYPSATLEDLRNAYTYQDPESGLRAFITEVFPIGEIPGDEEGVSRLVVNGEVQDRDGNRVGGFARRVERTRVVQHDQFVLTPEHRSEGFGSRFYRNSEEAYRRMGVRKVRLTANMTVGGYAWARMGFDWAENQVGKQSAIERVRYRWLAETQRFPNPPPFPKVEHAWELAALTTPSGVRVGKEGMLGSDWRAVKRLDADDEGARVGEIYYAEKDKKRRAD